MSNRTQHNPLAYMPATGRRYISPCCTASVEEHKDVAGQLWLVGHVIGHGWDAPRQGSIDDINDAGTIVEADGQEHPIYYDPGKEKP